MKITNKDLIHFLELGQYIIEVADQYAIAKFNESGSMYISDFDPEGNISFHMEWETGCMGCYDQHSLDFEMPFCYFTEDNWRDILQAEIEEAKRKQEEQDQLQLEKDKQRKESYERSEFERLQKIYGNS